MVLSLLFFFKETATTEIDTYGHTLSLPDALPIGLALDVGRLDPRAEAEQGDARLDRFGVAGCTEGTGLEDVGGVAAGRRGGGRGRRHVDRIQIGRAHV